MENSIVSRASANLAAQADSDVLYAEDLAAGAVAIVSEEVNSGTATMHLAWSPDGTNYFTFGSSITDGSSFPVITAIEDGSGNPLPAKFVKLVCSAYGASGEYKLTATGRQLKGFASV